MKIFLQMLNALVPERRITAMAPDPFGVDNAQMVSSSCSKFSSVFIGLLFYRTNLTEFCQLCKQKEFTFADQMICKTLLDL
jgi:hypothetical protein